jgi:hypothetical protein
MKEYIKNPLLGVALDIKDYYKDWTNQAKSFRA